MSDHGIETDASTEDESPADPVDVPLTVADEIDLLLPVSKGQLGAVAACLHSGMTDTGEIVETGAAANTSVVSNLISIIRTIRDGTIPTAPSRAQQSVSGSRSFLKQHGEVLSDAAVKHLEEVIAACEAVASDRVAQAKEEEQIQGQGAVLEDALDAEGGVYVYTYPHYWRHPTVEGTRRTFLKIGMTTKKAAERVRQQARKTGLPEDPLLLRVYQDDNIAPHEMEKRFHRLVTAADHVCEETTTGGKEWFETSIEFLDTVALEMGFRTLRADPEGD